MVVSNRGPIAHVLGADGRVAAAKTGGGLASGVRPTLSATGGLWISAPLNAADRHAGEKTPNRTLQADGITATFADIGEETYTNAVERVANECLWFIHHGLIDLAIAPTPDQWLAFRRYNRAMATAVAERADHDAIVLIQDYHLPLVAQELATARPDLTCVHFTHTPFAVASSWAALPVHERAEITAGMAAHRATGFHSQRWATRFEGCCELDGTEPPPTFIAPLAPDLTGMERHAQSERALEERRRLAKVALGSQLVVRVDRLEPTKNLLAGFAAFDDLLSRRRDLHGRVVLVSYAYPSRASLPAYQHLREATIAAVQQINERWGNTKWQPIELNLEDDLEAAAAGLAEFDVLLVNPIEDGLNLVAFEGAALNRRTGTIVLSRTCGAHDQLVDHVESIDPGDVGGTSLALERALELDPETRAARNAGARLVTMTRDGGRWLAAQIAAAD